MPVRSLLTMLITAGALSACEIVVEIAVPEHTPQLVSDGFFSPDSSWTVRLSQSTDITGTEDVGKLPITDAIVSVTAANGSFSETLAHAGGGIYTAVPGSHPVPGAAYTLRAEAPGLPSVQAVSSVPAAKASIAELERFDDPDDRFGREVYRLRIRIEDPPGTNYYKLELFRWSPFGEEDEFGYRPIVDEPGRPLAFMEIPFRSNETSFRYKDYAYFFEAPELSEEYDFDGALFSDELFEDKTKEFEITFTARSFETVESRYELVLSALSVDYFMYHHTVLLQNRRLDNQVAIEAALLQTPPVHLYSNVEKGLGVFAGYAVHTFGFDAEGNVWMGEEKR